MAPTPFELKGRDRAKARPASGPNSHDGGEITASYATVASRLPVGLADAGLPHAEADRRGNELVINSADANPISENGYQCQGILRQSYSGIYGIGVLRRVI